MVFSVIARLGLPVLLTGIGLVALLGCTPNKLIRTDVSGICTVDSDQLTNTDRTPSPCAHSSLEEVRVAAKLSDGTMKTGSYILGFTEFDDEGKTWDPQQERLIFDHMQREASAGDLSIIVFVHGWKHNVDEADDNVAAFQSLLKAVTVAELQPTDTQPRKVIGIYTGWRGETGPPGLLDNLTFWTRKDAAQRVAEGSIRGLLGKVRAFHDQLNALPRRPGQFGTRMVTIGHSFGGLIVYSALAQYFVDQAAASMIHGEYFQDLTQPLRTDDDPRLIPSYGDLVILINPAIEAMRYEPIRELVAEQHTNRPAGQSYARWQPPVMVEVTSVGDSLWQGDWATGLAFPLGRALDTGLESTTTDPRTHESEHAEILRTMGQYPPFWTHDLNISAQDASKLANAPDQIVLNQNDECNDLARFENSRRVNGYFMPGWQRTFKSGAVLQQNQSGPYDPNNPFWIIRAHPTVIKDHDDILNPVLKSFITQLFQDVYLLKDHKCQAIINAYNK